MPDVKVTTPPPAESVTPYPEIDRMVAELTETQPRLGALGPSGRAALARECLQSVAATADAWAARGAACKQIPETSPWAAEEIVLGPLLVVRYLQLAAEALEAAAEHGVPRLPGTPALGPDGRLRVPVFPSETMFDAAVFAGFSGTAIMDAGMGEAELLAAQRAHLRGGGPGSVALVLGAGNLTSIGPTDALERILARGSCVLLKPHPNFAAMEDVYRDALRPLVARGFLRICQGGAEVGDYAAHHPGIDEVHITGSHRAWEALVWGGGAEGRRRRAANAPRLTKPMTGELGNVTPWIVIPGEWTEDELRHQAEHLVGSLICNSGFNCAAPRVVVTSAAWRQRERFLNLVEEVLHGVAPRLAWYPGASERYAAYVGETARTDLNLPWAFLRGVDPDARREVVEQECFVGAFAEVPLAAADTADFVRAATAFTNDRVAGTLGVTLIVHPEARRQPEVEAAVERAVRELRYGTVGINQWSGMAFVTMALPWGGHPSATRSAPGSGIGWTHNPYALEGVEKSVFEGPFVVEPKPVIFPSNRNAGGILRGLLGLATEPGQPALERLVGEVALA